MQFCRRPESGERCGAMQALLHSAKITRINTRENIRMFGTWAFRSKNWTMDTKLSIKDKAPEFIDFGPEWHEQSGSHV
jgi:hypothetical protein